MNATAIMPAPDFTAQQSASANDLRLRLLQDAIRDRKDIFNEWLNYAAALSPDNLPENAALALRRHQDRFANILHQCQTFYSDLSGTGLYPHPIEPAWPVDAKKVAEVDALSRTSAASPFVENLNLLLTAARGINSLYNENAATAARGALTKMRD